MDPLATAFGRLGLSGTSAPRRTHLVVDALNYLVFFVPAKEPEHSQSSPWSLQAVMQQRVAAFLRGCKLSGWEPHFVIDTGYKSVEVLDKWKARREEEVRAEYRSMPCSSDISLAAVLKHQGADVLQPLNLDADDVVVRLAIAFNGVILSGDRDMVRYEDLDNKSQRVYEHFAFKKDGSLVLIPRVDFELRAEPRRADSVCLAVDEWRTPKYHTVNTTASTPQYVRGNPDSFTKAMDNLNLVARPLRQALYARLGYDVVQETFPEWDKECNGVTWHATSVAADSSLDALLDDPLRAFEWLANADNKSHTARAASGRDCRAWRSYSQAMLVAEYSFAARCGDTKHTKITAEPCSTPVVHELINIVRIAQSVDPRFSAEATATRDPWRIPTHLLEKMCSVCSNSSNCGYGELEYLWSKGFSQPKLCKQCRKRRKK